jgi:hypothetical protein
MHFWEWASLCTTAVGSVDIIWHPLSQPSWRCQTHATMLNPLNAELNPICHLLALLQAHHILHVSGTRVKKVTMLVEVSGPLQTKGFQKGLQAAHLSTACLYLIFCKFLVGAVRPLHPPGYRPVYNWLTTMHSDTKHITGCMLIEKSKSFYD